MDPLSISASVLTLLGAGGAIAKGVDRIRSLKKASDILLQLHNEISDLQLLIHAVNGFFHQHSDPDICDQQEIICAVLQRAKDTVVELEQAIAYVLTKETSTGSELNRVAWLSAFKKVKKLRADMRSVRNDLNTVWTVVTNK